MSKTRTRSSESFSARASTSAGDERVDRLARPLRTHSAFWIMARRVTLLAASVDLCFLVFFLAVHSPFLAWLNVVSIAMYGAAYLLLSLRKNRTALILIWAEVVGHAAIGTMLVGWESGFHYYLLMFIPAIVVSGGMRNVIAPLLLLFASYLGLYVAAHYVGSLAPMADTPLLILNLFNVAIFFLMASYTARFYYSIVKKTERKLRELATTDTLTGLSNRRHLLDLGQQEIARAARSGEQVSLILADIDDFKQVNDGFGHDAGDQVLVHISQLFQKSSRAHDRVARWGGEEFLFLLPATDMGAAMELAERLRQTVAVAQVEHDGRPITFSISIGVATLVDGEDLESAIGRADDALYCSKTEGRDRVTMAHTPEQKRRLLPASHCATSAPIV